MRQPEPSRTARVRTPARSLPASGSDMPMQYVASPARISGRYRSFWASVPWARIDGPICRSAIQWEASGAPAVSSSSVMHSRST